MAGDLVRGARAAQQHQLGREVPDPGQLLELREGLLRGQGAQPAASRRPSSAATARERSHSGLRPASPGNPSTETSRCGAGNADSTRPPKETASPSSLAIRALIAAACLMLIRAQMMAQAAASYGDQKPTGRRPG